MNYNVILIRYGEIALKGKNRSNFVNQLITNIRKATRDLGKPRIEKTYGRIFIYPEGQLQLLIDRLKMIPGIVSFSPAVTSSSEFERLKEISLQVLTTEINNYPATFKVDTKRSDKSYPLKSPEISREVGAYLLQEINSDEQRLTVDVHQPEHTLYIEIRKKNTYIYSSVIAGPGGLPIGSSGRGLLLLSGGIDSPVAGWLGMKRGIEVDALYFHSFPFTSDRAKEKVIDLAKVLSRYSGKMKLYVSFFTNIQRAIEEECPTRYYITIMRRMMFRIAARMTELYKHQVLLTGESVGQVASQTLESMSVINAVTNIPVLRPLVTMDKTEIMDISRMIDTYETSILPYEDCCTVFVPEHPVTKPRLRDALEAEQGLDIEALIDEAIEKTEIIEIGS